MRQMRRLFATIIDKTIKLRNRNIFHCKILRYVFPLYSTLLSSKWSLYFTFFNSQWSMVAIFRFSVLPVSSASTTRPTSRFRLTVTTTINIFSLSVFKKLSTKVEHSIGTWPTNVESSSCLCKIATSLWKLWNKDFWFRP